MNFKSICLHVILFLLLVSSHLDSQSTASIFTNTSLNTKKYKNKIVSYDDGFFTLFNVREAQNLNLVITKYDACRKPIWSRKYSYKHDLDLEYAIISDSTLTVLAITNFGNSFTRTPVLLNMNLDGEILFSYRYFKDKFENLINLQLYNNQYHLFGPTVANTDGGAHFIIDKSGSLIYSDALKWKIKDGGIDFGCTVLKDGTAIRRHNNTLVACDLNHEIIWAKRFVDHNSNELLESKPLAVDDGFIHILKKLEEFVIFKMNTTGSIVWSRKVKGQCFYMEPVSLGNRLVFIWKEPVEKHLMYTEMNDKDGSTLMNTRIEGMNMKSLVWPQLHASVQGDIYISGSLEHKTVKNLVVINPLISDCLDSFEQEEFERVILQTEDVVDEFEILPFEAISEKATISSIRIDHFMNEECESTIKVALDTVLDCQDSYVFDGTSFGTNIIWSDGRTDSIRYFDSPQNISVDVEACSLKYTVDLTIKASNCSCPLYAANTVLQESAFPANKKFAIYSSCDFEYFNLFIYDRWGNLVFQSNHIQESWNPQHQNLSQGVYVWYASFRRLNNSTLQRRSGHINYLK